MNVLLDILGATVIGACIFLMIFNFNVFSNQSKSMSDENLYLQRNAKTAASNIAYDLRKIGWGVDSTAVTLAQEKKISFYADIDSNGTVDRITYLLSDSTKAYKTQNPYDKILYRVVNNDTTAGPSLGITNIKFSYKNSSGYSTTDLSEIKYIKVEIWLQTTTMVDNKYPFTYWEMTINPRNI